MMSKIFSIIVLFIVLALTPATFAIEEEYTDYLPRTATEEVSEGNELNQGYETNSDKITTETYQAKNTMPYKQPISKKKLVKKFLLAMLAVGISSLFLYTTLSVYGKFRSINIKQVKTPKNTTPLVTPENYEDAVKTFLSKTDWD